LALKEEPSRNPYLNEDLNAKLEAKTAQNTGFCASPNLMSRTGKFGPGSGSGRQSASVINSEARLVGNFEDN